MPSEDACWTCEAEAGLEGLFPFLDMLERWPCQSPHDALYLVTEWLHDESGYLCDAIDDVILREHALQQEDIADLIGIETLNPNLVKVLRDRSSRAHFVGCDDRPE
jgi:hypothetical protein